jgi:hypothetical protein
MGRLEEGFERLHWPPLVREIVITDQYPGYRYEFFKSFRELNEYFCKECGDDWRTQPWAIYWISQHEETKHDDRQEEQAKLRSQPMKRTGNRRDIKMIYQIGIQLLTENPRLSSYKLVAKLKEYDITISQKTAWRLIKDYKEQQNEGHAG